MNLLEQETCPTSDYRTIPLTRGMVAIVDREDYEWLSQWKWHATTGSRSGGKFYAARRESRTSTYRMILMHRQILGIEDSRIHVDHVRQHETLDNRRLNIRIATPSQNAGNHKIRKDSSSGFKGVRQRNGRWSAEIRINRKLHCLGRFDTPEEAHEKYCEAAIRVFGEFACRG